MQDCVKSRLPNALLHEDCLMMHHIGFVVPCIATVIESFCRSVDGSGYSQTWHDPLQDVRVAFIYAGRPGSAAIELVEPVGEESPVRRFLQQGGGLHHVCYEVPDLRAALASAIAKRLTLIRRAQPAVAFAGRRIAWLMSKENLLIEYLESGVAV